ncbi:DNA-directed RNA polymerases II IV and V subunit 9A [Nymphaea thermarum]|nr:DNA-directed RNA polymerases II IV and V subunit 9A [Nymphaea thermarum]
MVSPLQGYNLPSSSARSVLPLPKLLFRGPFAGIRTAEKQGRNLVNLQSGRDQFSGAAMSTMKFCRECNNILYPKEDREQKVLLYACRNCDHQEVADNNCVYRNEIHHSVGERTQVLQDVAADPTLPRTRTVRCTVCNHGEAVFFQAAARGEEGMTLFFVCCNPNCGHRWRD